MRFTTDKWAASNGGRQPKGRGMWMFEFSFLTGGSIDRLITEAHGTLTEAKKAATAWARGIEREHNTEAIEAIILP